MKYTSLFIFIVILAGVGFPYLCYQESANVSNQTGTDGSCSLSYTGGYAFNASCRAGYPCANAYDGSWTTYTMSPASGSILRYYINFTKPGNVQSVGNLWNARIYTMDGYWYNFTIPTSCWEFNTTTLILARDSVWNAPNIRNDFWCMNASGWVNISTKTGASNIYDDAMYWNISDGVAIPNITSPTNNSYPNNVPFSVNCSGSDASYLLNITIDGVVNVTNQAVTNNSIYSTNITLAQGTHNTTATCANSTSNTSAVIVFTVYNAPTITLYTPLNNSGNYSSAIPFGYSASSPNDATLNCSIFINGTLNQSNASYANGTTGQFIVQGFQNGTYPWAVRCYGSLGNYGDSEIRSFVVSYDSGITPCSSSISKCAAFSDDSGSIVLLLIIVVIVIYYETWRRNK